MDYARQRGTHRLADFRRHCHTSSQSFLPLIVRQRSPDCPQCSKRLGWGFSSICQLPANLQLAASFHRQPDCPLPTADRLGPPATAAYTFGGISARPEPCRSCRSPAWLRVGCEDAERPSLRSPHPLAGNSNDSSALIVRRNSCLSEGC